LRWNVQQTIDSTRGKRMWLYTIGGNTGGCFYRERVFGFAGKNSEDEANRRS